MKAKFKLWFLLDSDEQVNAPAVKSAQRWRTYKADLNLSEHLNNSCDRGGPPAVVVSPWVDVRGQVVLSGLLVPVLAGPAALRLGRCSSVEESQALVAMAFFD